MTEFSAALPEILDGERLDRAIATMCDLSRSVAGALVDAGEVTVDGEVRTRRADRVASGQVLELSVPEDEPEATVTADPGVSVSVVHEDDELVVVDKPAGLVVHPGAGNASGTLAHGLLARYPELAGVGEPTRPGIVHRLDRDTSGLLVVARTTAALHALQGALRARTVTRRYRALVWGSVTQPSGLIDAPIARAPRDPTKMAVVVGGREARTGYEVVARYSEPVEVTELQCRLETGRTHQIRVHLRAIDHPVVGDERYGGSRPSFPVSRHFLHAEHLAFTHPTTGAAMEFDSPIPHELADVLDRLT